MDNQKLTLQTILTTAAVLVLVALFTLYPFEEVVESPKPPSAAAPIQMDWSWNGPLGTFERGDLQRGFHVYKDICSACHSLNMIAFRNLEEIGFNEDEVKVIASDYFVPGDPDEFGDPTERAAIPSDYWPASFANETAARFANNGALPPDLSLITKARPGGPDYLYSLLVGFEDVPADFELGAGMNYNPYFAGHQIAMGPPLFEDMVEYADGTAASVDQMARDVTSFLTWAAEPTLEARHVMGYKVMLFLLVWLIIMIISNRRVWRGLKEG